jgi:diguanylate cyclase (GGDEF)-like protein
VRYGGDEFVVLLHAVRSQQQVEQMVERIATEIRIPIALADGQLIVTASIGLAVAHDAAETQDLLETADQAMYRAKRAGRRPSR